MVADKSLSRRNLFRRGLDILNSAARESRPDVTARPDAADRVVPVSATEPAGTAPPATALEAETPVAPELQATPETILQRIAAEPAYRLILPRLLGFCCEPRTSGEIHEAMLYYPEMRAAAHLPELLLGWMVEAGAISGTQETPAAEIRWQTTAAGMEAIAADDPGERMRRLFEDDPAYVDIYYNLIRFCQEGRSLDEIEWLLRAHPVLQNPLVYPAYLLDRLEFAGALEWTGRWQTSDFGKEFLSQS